MPKRKNSVDDSMRRLALLWGSQTEPGRSGLTVKAIVTAAIEIADAEGLQALSMRSVAERLGVGTMSLYTHVPGKGELVDLMLDTAYGELYSHVEEPAQHSGWQAGLRFIAQRNWDLFRKHPWMLQLPNARPVIGPHSSLKYEAELRPLDGIGLSDLEMDAVLTTLLIHVEGCARMMVATQQAHQDSGMTDLEWWVIQAPLLDRIIDSSHFPVATRVGNAAGEEYQAVYNPEYLFRFGLERILAGVEALLHK